MKDMFTVAKFTLLDMIKRKSFIISTIIILLMIIVGFNIPNIINSFKGKDEVEKIAILDKNNIFEDNIKEDTIYNYEIIISNEKIKDVEKKIVDEEYDSAIIIDKIDNNISMTYLTRNLAFNDGPSEEFTNYLTALYKTVQINKLNVSESDKESINPNFIFDMRQAGDEVKGNVFVMMLMSIVLFYAIYFCAFQVSSSITTEKTSKIIETLVTSTSPKNIVIGKTVGIGIAGLVQVLAVIVTAYISANIFIDKTLLNTLLDTSTLTISLLLITLLYFILGYLTFSFLYALTGSTVSKPEDIQSANGPVAMISVVGFYLSYFTMMNPTSNLNHFAALFPFSSPFCMPFRIMMGLSTPSEIILSILILLISILVISKISIKIYSSAIINYGTKAGIKNLIKLYKEK